EAEEFFRPEFFNRIDRVVAFWPLSLEAMRLITRRELGKLLMREGIVRRNLLVEIDDSVIEHLLVAGFDSQYGARPLQRQIERQVILPLARLVAEQRADHRHLLRFGVRAGQIHLGLIPIEIPEDLAPSASDRQPLEATDLAAVVGALQTVRDQIKAEENAQPVRELRQEVTRLLKRTHEPAFWDDARAAREVLSRIYHLERILKRLDALAERTDSLLEKGRQMRLHRDRRGVPEFARVVDVVTSEFAYLQLELMGDGAGADNDRAVIRVTPLSSGAGSWADRLLAMYTTWARRKGYEFRLIEISLAREPRNDGAGRASEPELASLFVQGSNVHRFLRGESGIHKLTMGGQDKGHRHLARVTVYEVPDAEPADDSDAMKVTVSRLVGLNSASPEQEDERAPVVRLYHDGRHHFVRDPRTGVRHTDLSAILDGGQIDPFLLATARQLSVKPLPPRPTALAVPT
ncbi:MAG TPA: PCRF domain-containing protein, partial [Chloroflexota bacterium]|nr:PCRF domain-containing protein [Chloroflexota bacterium]